MALLKTKKNIYRRNEMKFVGGYLPDKLTHFVSLYATAKEKTKNALLKEIIQDWRDALFSEEKEQELIQNVIERSQKAWNTSIANTNIHTFKKILKVELSSMGLSIIQIEHILNSIINEKSKKK